MKFHKILSISSVVLMMTVMLTFNFSCKVKNPMEGFNITIKPDAVSAPNSYSFISSKTGNTEQGLEGVVVTLTGPSAPSLYTSDGLQTFKIVAGQIGVCVRKGVNPTPSIPLVFDINFSAPGYMSKNIRQEITSLLPTTQTISVLNLDDLPKTSSKKDTTFTSGASGTTAPVTITTASTDSVPSVSVKVPIGTQFLDNNNVPFTGTVSSTLVYSEPTGGNDMGAYPLDPMYSDFIDDAGNPVNSVFAPEKVLSIEFSGGGKALSAVFASNPLHVPGFDTGTVGKSKMIINNLGKTVITSVKGDTIPTKGKLGSLGELFSIDDATISFTDPENGKYYDLEIGNSVTGFSIKITPGKSPVGFKIIGSYSYLVKKVKGSSIVQTISISSGTNTITLGKPAGEPKFYSSKFSVYCKDQSTYMVLPEGWPLYLIKKTDYDATTVADANGGHKVQPSDNGYSNLFIKVLAQSPISADGVVYNKIDIPISSLATNTEYLAITVFGSKGLIFNDFNNPSGKLLTPAFFPPNQDFIPPPIKMDINQCN